MYVLHAPLLKFVVDRQVAFAGIPGWQIGVGFAVALLVLSHWAYVTVERPGRRLLLGLWPTGAPAGHAADLVARLVSTLAVVVGLVAVTTFVERRRPSRSSSRAVRRTSC